MQTKTAEKICKLVNKNNYTYYIVINVKLFVRQEKYICKIRQNIQLIWHQEVYKKLNKNK